MRKQKTFYAVEFVRLDGKSFARRQMFIDGMRGPVIAFRSRQKARHEVGDLDRVGIPARVVALRG